MNDFIFHNPDKVYFGRNQMKNLPGELLSYGRKVLLVYGGGSIKRNGLYDKIVSAVRDNGMEHELSAYYDITHGHGLAILTPRWLIYILNDETAPAICRLGETVFGLEKSGNVMDGAKAAIEAVRAFAFDTLGLEPFLSKLGIDETHFKAMAEHVCGESGIIGLRSLNVDDVVNIYKMCL